eukprot:g180.t1
MTGSPSPASIFAAVCLCGLATPVVGIIRPFRVLSPATRPADVERDRPRMSVSLVREFGVARGGYLSIRAQLSDGADRVIFSLFSQYQWEDGYQRLMSQRQWKEVCMAPAAVRLQTSGTLSEHRFRVPYTDLYTLQLTSCWWRDGVPGAPPAPELVINGTVEIANVDEDEDEGAAAAAARDGDGGGAGGATAAAASRAVDHLPLGQRRAVALYWALVLLYTALGLLLLREIHQAWQRRSPEPLLYGCALALAAKLAALLVHLAELERVRSRGLDIYWLASSRGLLQSVAEMTFLGQLLVTSLGWCLVRARLTVKERQALAAVFGLYTVVAVVKAFCGKPCAAYELCLSSPQRACSASVLAEYVIKLLVMLGIIVAMNYNITHLRTVLHDERWHEGRSADMYAKLHKLQAFRLAFLIVLLFPTVLLIVRITVFTWRYEWAAEMLNETLTLSVYIYMGMAYRPNYGARLASIATIINRHGVQLQPMPEPEPERDGALDDGDAEDARDGAAVLYQRAVGNRVI